MGVDFLLTSLVIVASPGIGVLITAGAGLSHGPRASIVAAFGCTIGIIPHLIAAITGLAAVLYTSSVAFQLLKYLGVAYLLYLAWTTLREKGAFQLETNGPERTTRQVIIAAVLANLLNPKLSIFFFAFLPQFVSADDPSPLFRMLSLSLVFMAMTFVVFAIYGLFAAAARRHVISRPRVLTWLRRTFAAAFVGLGVKLALTER
jgi:threonine/homoserine/homoserine lactone efflux protein